MAKPGGDGAPAAPSPQYEKCPNCEHPIPWSAGFTKRERIAMEVMKALLANMPSDSQVVAKDIALDAVSLADALTDALGAI